MISAGEASGDMYAAGVVSHLSKRFPGAEFYGCAGPKLQRAGVQPVIDAGTLAVVGLAEVISHLPRIYGQYRKLVRFTEAHRPDAAILTDSPDFHLRVARHLKRIGVPVFYLVAPQVWAWRQGRVKTIRQRVDKLFCLFPFEEDWFRQRGVDATYIGHPLAAMVRPAFSKEQFFVRHLLDGAARTVVLLPGSRTGEVQRHMPVLLDAVERLRARYPLNVLLAIPKGFYFRGFLTTFSERIQTLAIQVIEDETWDSIAHADLALAASGTVTIEAAVLGTPMVTFYRVNPLSWLAGRRLVKVPFFSMVNLIAERRIVPELIQHDMTPGKIVAEAGLLLDDATAARQMRADLAEVRALLTREGDPLERAADLIYEHYRTGVNAHSGGTAVAGRQ